MHGRWPIGGVKPGRRRRDCPPFKNATKSQAQQQPVQSDSANAPLDEGTTAAAPGDAFIDGVRKPPSPANESGHRSAWVQPSTAGGGIPHHAADDASVLMAIDPRAPATDGSPVSSERRMLAAFARDVCAWNGVLDLHDAPVRVVRNRAGKPLRIDVSLRHPPPADVELPKVLAGLRVRWRPSYFDVGEVSGSARARAEYALVASDPGDAPWTEPVGATLGGAPQSPPASQRIVGVGREHSREGIVRSCVVELPNPANAAFLKTRELRLLWREDAGGSLIGGVFVEPGHGNELWRVDGRHHLRGVTLRRELRLRELQAFALGMHGADDVSKSGTDALRSTKVSRRDAAHVLDILAQRMASYGAVDGFGQARGNRAWQHAAPPQTRSAKSQPLGSVPTGAHRRLSLKIAGVERALRALEQLVAPDPATASTVSQAVQRYFSNAAQLTDDTRWNWCQTLHDYIHLVRWCAAHCPEVTVSPFTMRSDSFPLHVTLDCFGPPPLNVPIPSTWGTLKLSLEVPTVAGSDSPAGAVVSNNYEDRAAPLDGELPPTGFEQFTPLLHHVSSATVVGESTSVSHFVPCVSDHDPACCLAVEWKSDGYGRVISGPTVALAPSPEAEGAPAELVASHLLAQLLFNSQWRRELRREELQTFVRVLSGITSGRDDAGDVLTHAAVPRWANASLKGLTQRLRDYDRTHVDGFPVALRRDELPIDEIRKWMRAKPH